MRLGASPSRIALTRLGTLQVKGLDILPEHTLSAEPLHEALLMIASVIVNSSAFCMVVLNCTLARLYLLF